MAILGELEHLVLLAVVRLEGRGYAVSVHDEIEKRARVRLARGAVYVTLGRLEKKGYLESSFGEPTSARGGKAKRLFKVKPAGLRAVRQSRRALEGMWAGLETVAEKP